MPFPCITAVLCIYCMNFLIISDYKESSYDSNKSSKDSSLSTSQNEEETRFVDCMYFYASSLMPWCSSLHSLIFAQECVTKVWDMCGWKQ